MKDTVFSVLPLKDLVKSMSDEDLTEYMSICKEEIISRRNKKTEELWNNFLNAWKKLVDYGIRPYYDIGEYEYEFLDEINRFKYEN